MLVLPPVSIARLLSLTPAAHIQLQARLLWPDVPIECVVSLGVGATPVVRRERSLHSYFDTGAVLIESACSVERAHEAMMALTGMTPGLRYFRCAAASFLVSC